MEPRGLVYNIQRFSIHDGPGIRTTVFLKGCPLSCLWCSNPESMSFKSQLMVRDIKCAGCGECVEVCQRGAIDTSKQGRRRIDWSRCNHCFECVDACLYGALAVMGKPMTRDEIVAIVEQDEVFYRNSGGGVTISGGEPLSQYSFLAELLEGLKAKGLHVALDTTGHTRESVLRRILGQVDLVLFDIKHLDPERHRQYTGVDNATILANARIAPTMATTWFRVPLIAGVNDSEEHFRQLAQMAVSLGVEKISLLPYHEGGVSKAVQIGMPGEPFRARPPDELQIQQLVTIGEEAGVPVTVGS
jgi:pyruvate formate lyase activating enzyme